MEVITLTTDFGTKNFWLSAIKTKLLKALPEYSIVDISHEISPYNYLECAYIIRSSIPFSHPWTIHIIGFEVSPTPESQILIIQYKNQYFIVGDNGLMGLIASKNSFDKIISVSELYIKRSSFMTLDTLTPLAIELAKNKSPEKLGTEVTEIELLKPELPILNSKASKIIGQIIFIDRFGNLVTNISKTDFYSIGRDQHFRIIARGFRIETIYDSYADCAIKANTTKSPLGSKFALFNSNNLLELGIYKGDPKTVGSANTLYGLKYRDHITIEFFEPQ